MFRDIDRGLPMKDLARYGGSLFEATLRMPFRFTPAEQAFWRDYAEQVRYPATSSDWDRIITLSQNHDYAERLGHVYLSHVKRAAMTEDGLTDSSKLHLIQAGSVLRNLVWRDGPHVSSAVKTAQVLMEPDNSVLIREAGSGVVKNAAWFEGEHISDVISVAVRDWPDMTPRMLFDLLRAIWPAASRHSLGLLQRPNVREFLEKASAHRSPDVSEHARKALNRIFGN